MTDKCPNCGYCPACGRSDRPVIPWQPVPTAPYYGPWWGIYPPSTAVPPYTFTIGTAAPINTDTAVLT